MSNSDKPKEELGPVNANSIWQLDVAARSETFQLRATRLFTKMLQDFNCETKAEAMDVMSNAGIVLFATMVQNSDKLTVQKLLSQYKQMVADMPAPGQIITDIHKLQ